LAGSYAYLTAAWFVESQGIDAEAFPAA